MTGMCSAGTMRFRPSEKKPFATRMLWPELAPQSQAQNLQPQPPTKQLTRHNLWRPQPLPTRRTTRDRMRKQGVFFKSKPALRGFVYLWYPEVPALLLIYCPDSWFPSWNI